jgi:ribosomal protein S18 acetylase RimI-like enzyme
MIRQMTLLDIDEVANLYEKYMFDSSFAKLGPRFIKILFKAMISSPQAILYVNQIDSKVTGFICASFDTGKMIKEIIFRNMPVLIKIIFSDFPLMPQLFKSAKDSLFYLRKSKYNNITAELLFIALDPAHRSKGIAQELVNVVLTEFRNKGVDKVKVTILENNHTVKKLLENLRFNMVSSFNSFGKKTLMYDFCLQ